ncbi:MAG: nucleotide-binding protein [Dehalococcoidia bacterium]|nr:nucleotide-binding protein [Dehalococcoidia bacterium]
MMDRFRGEHGRRRLLDAVKGQRIVGNDESVANAIVERLDLKQFYTGENIIEQGGKDNDLYLILSGRVEIRVNDRAVAFRETGMHVGEIALIDPTARRIATVRAVEQTLVGVISEPDFTTMAQAYPGLWRAIAVELGNRLNQRGRFLAPPNSIPALFIGSSKEVLPVAEAIRTGFADAGFNVILWSEGVFGASHFPIEDLVTQLSASDFAVLLAGADDRVISRGQETDAPRDNVIFELGLFMGALGRHRTFIAVPEGAEIKVPNDLLGLIQLRWDPDIEPVTKAVLGICGHLKRVIKRLGPK